MVLKSPKKGCTKAHVMYTTTTKKHQKKEGKQKTTPSLKPNPTNQ